MQITAFDFYLFFLEEILLNKSEVGLKLEKVEKKLTVKGQIKDPGKCRHVRDYPHRNIKKLLFVETLQTT